MTELKCPYCNKQLQHAVSIDRHDFYWCPNYDCDSSSKMVGTEETWEALIRTRKALDVAVDALKRLEKELYFNNAKQTGHIADSVMSIPSIALEQITALEQKD